MKKILMVIAALSLLTACGDGNKKDNPTQEKVAAEKAPETSGEAVHSEGEEGHSEGEESTVLLTAEQMKTANIDTGTVELKNLTSSIRSNGTLIVPNQNKALITSVNSGVLKTLLIQPGSFVRKGQVVASVVNPDAARLQQELQVTNAQIRMAETELRRQQELVTGNAAPLKNVQRVQTELATLRVNRNAVSKQLTAMGISAASVSRGNIITTISITSPISGTVSTVTAQIGSPVDASTPIAEIVNNAELHLDLFVYEKDLAALHAGQVIHFTVTNNPGREYDAKIFSIGTAFASESKTIPVHAVVQGDKANLIEGMNVTALISIGTNVVSSVPTEAIVSNGGNDYIFIRSAPRPGEAHEEAEHKGEKPGEAGHEEEGHDEKPGILFERVQVVKGASDVGYTEIKPLKNIPPKSVVITKGAFFVLAKMTNTGGHGH